MGGQDLQTARLLERLRRQPGRSPALAWFEQAVAGELPAAAQPLVGTLCRLVPEELILAAGAQPIRLDVGGAQLEQSAERCFPQDACPAARAFAGGWEEQQFPGWDRLRLLIVPACCDAKKKLASLLSPQREIFVLEPPAGQTTPAARRWWQEQLAALQKKLEQVSGRKITRRTLGEAAALVNRRAQAARRLNELRAREPAPVSGSDCLLAFQAAFRAPPVEYTERLEALLAALEKVPGQPGEGKPRLVLSGSPIYWPEFTLPLLLEESGARLVADDLCSGTESLHHPHLADENSLSAHLEAAADRTLLTAACPIFTDSAHRRERLLEQVRAVRADGVVIHVLRHCLPFDAEAILAERSLKSAGVPVLVLRCGYGEEEARLKTRVEAFLEVLAGRGRDQGSSSTRS